MANAVVDLKMIVSQDRGLVLEVLELGNTLVFDVKAEHWWTTHSLETYGQLNRIFGNLVKLLELTEADWGKGAALFSAPEGNKLWTTAVALWRALPPIRAKYIEILARRRRQRIMGAKIEEIEELDPTEVQQELDRLAEYSNSLRTLLTDLQQWIDKIPEGLAPELTIGETERIGAARQAVAEREPSVESAADEGDTESAEAESVATTPPVAATMVEGGSTPGAAVQLAPNSQSLPLVDTDEFSPV